MIQIKTLHDLVELGIKLSKQETPDGFICTVFLTPENREAVVNDLLEHKIEYEFWKIDKVNSGGYNFKILGINFLIF